ncbi:MAG: hypothetical protein Q9O24_07050 [Gammaproteobacteria bacterium]|nr:hypothetical protein [Gammaproteobacteria bacterium]
MIKKWALVLFSMGFIAIAYADHCDKTGIYGNESSDLEIRFSEGIWSFSLLTVSERGRTGDLEANFTLDGEQGQYKNTKKNCAIRLQFLQQLVVLKQMGSCEMGMGVNASGEYALVTLP